MEPECTEATEKAEFYHRFSWETIRDLTVMSRDTQEDNDGLVIGDNGNGNSRSDMNNDDSDEFGNFSDASFENEDEEQDVMKYLDQLLPDSECSEDSSKKNSYLEQLILDERPHVIYEQVIQLRTTLRPFVWKNSRMKSNLWHILRIPDEEPKKKKSSDQEPLDDSLFTQLRSLIMDANIHTNFVLREHFKTTYNSPLTPASLQAIQRQTEEKEIPKLLTTRLESVEKLQDYHDKLCHAIDVLFVELQQLNKRQSDLEKDKTTFENVVTNLTGHTQRLYRDEIAIYNRRHKRKNKFSWGH